MAAGAGLSTSDVATLREALTAGRRPKVVFTAAAGQMAGQTGQVIGLTDPDGSDEFVVVRFGKDELPFSPADLSLAPRAARGTRTGRVTPVEPPEFKLGEPPAPAPTKETRMNPAPASSSPTQQAAGREPAAAGKEPAKDAVPDPAPIGELASAARPRKAAKAGKPKAPAALTVTLAYADGEWTVGAQQGSRALAKPYVIKPGEALKMVGMLDVPGVTEAVEQILAAERSQAQAAAQRLRAELAEIEARLAELA